MLAYALRRLLGTIPTLFVIIALAFFLVRLAPGGPFMQEQALPPEIAANLDRAYGLDQPMHRQFLSYVGGLMRGDLGPSFRYKDFSVAELIADGLPVTVTLGIAALLLAICVGVPLGLAAGLNHRRAADRIVMAVAVLGIVVPGFVVAPVLALVFGLKLQWLPVGGYRPGEASYLILPTLTLALPLIAYIARLTRGSLLETLQAPYIRTARANGLPWSRIVRRHALPPTLLPVLSFLGPSAAALLTGSLVVEQAFNLPGIGRHFVQGAINRDYTLVMGMVVFYAVAILLLNLLVDLLYGWLDPRIRRD